METNIEFLNMIMGLQQSLFKKMDKLTDSVEDISDYDTCISDTCVLDMFEEHGYTKKEIKNIGRTFYTILFDFAINTIGRDLEMTDEERELCECDAPCDGGYFYFNGIEFTTKEQLINLVKEYRRKNKRGFEPRMEIGQKFLCVKE